MLPLSISARGSSACRLLGKLWPLPRIRREASTFDSIVFEKPRAKSRVPPQKGRIHTHTQANQAIKGIWSPLLPPPLCTVKRGH